MSYGEAAALIRGIHHEIGSHYYMAAQDWSYPISLPDIVAVMGVEAFLNINRDTKVQPSPFRLPRPWDGKQEETFTEDEKATAIADLKRRSAFRDDD